MRALHKGKVVAFLGIQGQALKEKVWRRNCFKCKKHIERTHKYYNLDGRRIHRDCKNPTQYRKLK